MNKADMQELEKLISNRESTKTTQNIQIKLEQIGGKLDNIDGRFKGIERRTLQIETKQGAIEKDLLQLKTRVNLYMSFACAIGAIIGSCIGWALSIFKGH